MSQAEGNQTDTSSAQLQFSDTELEQLCGLEINAYWVGSPWAGAYRLGSWHRGRRLKTLLLEGSMLGMGSIATLPLALGAMLRFGVSAWVFGMTLAIAALLLMLLHHLMLWRNGRRWRSLLLLLDAVDRFHHSLEAVELLRSLDAISQSPSSLMNHSTQATLEALRLTRDSLVTGLITERLLRNRQPFLSRCYELLDHLDKNWSELHRLETERQASQQSLQESLAISTAVREELRALLHRD